MHCPRCGQQQVSEDIKFCSRCGFSLGLVSEILANGGVLPQLVDLHKSKGIFTKRNGIIFGGLWMFIWLLFITPLVAIGNPHSDAPAVTSIIGLMGGILIMLLSAFFLKSTPKGTSINYSNAVSNQLKQPNNQQALPPQQSISTEEYVSPKMSGWRETNDLVQPPSVTDNTTKLLEKDK